MGGTRSYFRVGLSVAAWLFCAQWALLTVPMFLRLMERSGESTLEVIWTFLLAVYVALVYLLWLFWWLVIPLLGLPPFIGLLLDDRQAIKARNAGGGSNS